MRQMTSVQWTILLAPFLTKPYTTVSFLSNRVGLHSRYAYFNIPRISCTHSHSFSSSLAILEWSRFSKTGLNFMFTECLSRDHHHFPLRPLFCPGSEPPFLSVLPLIVSVVSSWILVLMLGEKYLSSGLASMDQVCHLSSLRCRFA